MNGDFHIGDSVYQSGSGTIGKIHVQGSADMQETLHEMVSLMQGAETNQPALHRTILIVDVEGYGDPARTSRHHLAVREGLYAALKRSFAEARIAWSICEAEDRGDGVFFLVPPDVPKSLLVTSLPVQLAKSLALHNGTHPAESRIRLRMALHAGEVYFDTHGVAGVAVNYTFRLIEEPSLKTDLRSSAGVLALIVSDWFYDEVVRHEEAAYPSRFQKVPVKVKETYAEAWVRILEPSFTHDDAPFGQPSTPAVDRDLHSRMDCRW